ncbi:hypothetical protein K466DRAFT_505888 [Polyporus arcularius HHB13444]|uniref:2OGFeDO JBP1/TET oxygenase domain-containing protein n=1 Tax=Polyporus arcularius HHB13444 TaxID=1314778 RepID=A0A5C3NS75_9APHY|nr:hypothetical protein K466DRAFT_505888 [Polyporus arcularius HHB13444]
MAIVNSEGELLAIFPHTPKGSTWQQVIQDATIVMSEARAESGKDSAIVHRRGAYCTEVDGWSYGGGQPVSTSVNYRSKQALHKLRESPAVQKIAGFGNDCLKTYAPDLYVYYETTRNKIEEQFPELERVFTNSVFASTTFNLGPRTVTFGHRDHQNLPFGWCCVTALGNFDDTKGGHLILWDLNLVIRIPAGATYLIPSAILKHSNVDIAPGETRMSITQYSAGGLFRWVACGMRSQAAYVREGNKMPSGEDRWHEGIALLRKWSGNPDKPIS